MTNTPVDNEPSTPTFNREAIAEWVAALRSGSYMQAKGRLTRIVSNEGDRAYCCLGVACDVFADRLNMTSSPADDRLAIVAWKAPGEDGRRADLPRAVVDYLGLKDPNPPITGGITPVSATQANDELGWTFDQIADAIEKTYLTGTTKEAS